jgi:hypothetical protein
MFTCIYKKWHTDNSTGHFRQYARKYQISTKIIPVKWPCSWSSNEVLPGMPHTVPAVKINAPMCNADTSVCNHTRTAVEVPTWNRVNYHKKKLNLWLHVQDFIIYRFFYDQMRNKLIKGYECCTFSSKLYIRISIPKLDFNAVRLNTRYTKIWIYLLHYTGKKLSLILWMDRSRRLCN